MGFMKSKQEVSGLQVGVCITPEGIAIASIDSAVPAGTLPRLNNCQFITTPKKSDQSNILVNMVKTQKLEGAKTVCILSASQYDLFLIEEPEVTPAELLAAVRWKVKDYLEYPIEEAVIDYMSLPSRALDVKGKMGYAVVAKQVMIDDMVQLMSSAGLKVMAVDVAESAVCHVMSNLKEMTDGFLCFRLLPGVSQIIILKGGLVMLMRNVDLNQDYLFAPREVDGQPIVPTDDEKDKFMNDIALEIQRSIEYSVTNLKQGTVRQVVFMPANSFLEPLIEELKEGLGMNVRLMQLSEVATTAQKMSLIEQGQCVLAVGGALRKEDPLK